MTSGALNRLAGATALILACPAAAQDAMTQQRRLCAFLMDLYGPIQAIACGQIADTLAQSAAAAADPSERADRLPLAWRLSQ